MRKVGAMVLAIMLVATPSCKKGESGTSGVNTKARTEQEIPIDKLPPCDELVYKLQQCVEKDRRFNVKVFREWLVEDCKSMREKEPQAFRLYAQCLRLPCAKAGECLRNLEAKRK